MNATTRWILVSGLVLVIFSAIFILMAQVNNNLAINTDRAAVITQMQQLQRLETAQFTIEKVIDAQTTGPEWQRFLFGDRLLLIAHARVVAGVDMAKMSEEDIVIQGKKVSLTLPATEIFGTDLDESKTQVYDRQKGLLSKGQDQLESQARQAAEQTMTTAACEGGILVTAATNAASQLTTLLKALAFDEVVVTAPPGSC